MAMVRNSIGPEGYVADELVTSRAGVRVRIGNTDAEGRMAMVDLLCYLKEKVIKESHPNPHFFTIATLTGHACLAAGDFSSKNFHVMSSCNTNTVMTVSSSS